MHIFNLDMHFMFKANLFLLSLVVFWVSCTEKPHVDSSTNTADHYFESKTITQSLRDSIGMNSFIELKDGFTYYELSGPESGDVIVLVHGYSVPSYIWDSTYVAAINRGYRVLRFDVFGRGFSDRPTVAYDIDLSYRQLSGIIDSLSLTTPVNLVGLSWGGRVTSYYTALNPSKVSKLVLVDPSGFESVAKKDSSEVKVTNEAVIKAIKERAPLMADSQLEDFYHPDRFDYWPSLYRPQMEYKGFVHALLSTQANKRDLSKIMAKLSENGTPVKMIMGKEDQVVRPAVTIPLAKVQIPSIDITLIDNAGHLPHIEETEAFNKMFFVFLEN